MDEFLKTPKRHSPPSPVLNSSNADQQKFNFSTTNNQNIANSAFSQNIEILDFDFPYKLPKLSHSVSAHSISSLDSVPEFLPTSNSTSSLSMQASHKRGQSLNLLTNMKNSNSTNFNEMLAQQQQQSSLYMTRPARSMTTSSLLMTNSTSTTNPTGTPSVSTAANSTNLNPNRSRSKLPSSRSLHSIGVNPFYTGNVSKMNTSISNPSLLLSTASPTAIAEGSPLNTPLPTPSQSNFNDFSPLSTMFFDEHSNSTVTRSNHANGASTNRIPKSRSFNHSITTSISSSNTSQNNAFSGIASVSGGSHRRKRSSIDLQNDHIDSLINFNSSNSNTNSLVHNSHGHNNSISVQLPSQIEDESVNSTLIDTAVLESNTFGFLDDLDLGNDTFLLNNKDHEWNKVVNAAAANTIFSSGANFGNNNVHNHINNSNPGITLHNGLNDSSDSQFDENFNSDIFLKAADITLKMVSQSKPKPTTSFAEINDASNDFKIIMEDIESSSNTTTAATATNFMNNNDNNSAADLLNGNSHVNNDSMVFSMTNADTSTPSPTTGVINTSAYNSCSSLSSSNSTLNTNANNHNNPNTTTIITSSGKTKVLAKPKTRSMRAKSTSAKDLKKNPNILTADEMTPDEVEKAKALLPEGLHESNLIIKKSKRGRSKSSLDSITTNDAKVNENDKNNDNKNNNENNDNSKSKKIHECPLCFAVFQRPEHVKRHMRSHSSEKPYQCELCQKRFNRSDNLKAHLRKLHNAAT